VCVWQGKKVLLVDAEAQANHTMALGYNKPDDIPIILSTIMQGEKLNQREKPQIKDERITKLKKRSQRAGIGFRCEKALEFYNRHLNRKKEQER